MLKYYISYCIKFNEINLFKINLFKLIEGEKNVLLKDIQKYIKTIHIIINYNHNI